MLIAILICLYTIAGLQVASAMSKAYDPDKWYSLWLCVIGWPCYVAFSLIGIIVEGFTALHNVMFPKDGVNNGR